MRTLARCLLSFLICLASAAQAHEEFINISPSDIDASGSYSTLVPALAVDNNQSTMWSPGALSGWLRVNTGAITVSRVEVVVVTAGTATYTVEISNDNVNWFAASTATGPTDDSWVVNLPVNASASWVRVSVSSATAWPNVREIRVYKMVPQSASAPQFVAKMYTEAFGRAPDAGGLDYWSLQQIRDLSGGCNADNLRAVAREFYINAAEYWHGDYNWTHRLVTLYRGLYSREPDSGLSWWATQLSTSAWTWTNVVNYFLYTSEFTDVVAKACNQAVPGYQFGARLFSYAESGLVGAVGVVSPIVIGTTYTTAQLNAALATCYGNPACSTVTLPQDSIVYVTSTIELKNGRTLTTSGNPDLHAYAAMARFVRAGDFNTALIDVSEGSRLQHVWVDGGRGTSVSTDGSRRNAANIFMGTTAATNQAQDNSLYKVRSDNAVGGANVFLAGRNNALECLNNSVTQSLFTGYSGRSALSGGFFSMHTDGLTVFCEDTEIDSNQFVDMTDGAVVLFAGYPGVLSGGGRAVNTPQRSQVTNNYAVNAGNNAHWGFVLEPRMQGPDSNFQAPRMFDGTLIEDNSLKTSDMTHVTTAFGAGTQTLWADYYSYVFGTCNTTTTNFPLVSGETRDSSFLPQPCVIQDNTFVGRTAVALGLHGMSGATVTQGTNTIALVPSLAVSPSFSCTKSTTVIPTVCNSGSTTCPGTAVSSSTTACY